MTASKSVLVVDDDAAFSRLVCRFLEGAGYGASVASTGEEALARAAQSRPAAILVDVILGGANGFELAARLKEASGVPVVMMTGASVDDDTRRDAQLLGFSGVLEKPFSKDALLSLVKSLI